MLLCLSTEVLTTSTCHLLLQLVVCAAGMVSSCESCLLVLSAAKASHLFLVGIYKEGEWTDILFPSTIRDHGISSKVLSVHCWSSLSGSPGRSVPPGLVFLLAKCWIILSFLFTLLNIEWPAIFLLQLLYLLPKWLHQSTPWCTWPGSWGAAFAVVLLNSALAMPLIVCCVQFRALKCERDWQIG